MTNVPKKRSIEEILKEHNVYSSELEVRLLKIIENHIEAERQKREEELYELLEKVEEMEIVGSWMEKATIHNKVVWKVKELIEILTHPNNPKEDWSQCNDCFDGLHNKCIGVDYGCECEHKITQPNNPK